MSIDLALPSSQTEENDRRQASRCEESRITEEDCSSQSEEGNYTEETEISSCQETCRREESRENRNQR